jgi:hypothetical protein
MADLREDFVNYVVKALVSNPDEVSLRRASDEKGDYLELRVESTDMGKVIGKAGATAKSIRTLLRGVGAKDNLPPLPLKIVDPEGYNGAADNSEAEVEAVAEAPVEPKKDEHEELRERTKREAEELADLEL